MAQCLVQAGQLYKSGHFGRLAPVLAMGVAAFGIQNMLFLVFLTSIMQAVIWKFNWRKYILLAVPTYLVEGLLAGIGLKIALKFLPFTYEIPINQASAETFWNMSRIQMSLISLTAFVLFVYLFSKYQKTNPAISYFTLIISGVVVAQFINVPTLTVEDVDLKFALPLPHFDNALIWVYAISYSFMLAAIDVIEQVMSNAAIEKLDPLKRRCVSNNSLMAIWISNIGSSFFGGMTNLDGLAKKTVDIPALVDKTKNELLAAGSSMAAKSLPEGLPAGIKQNLQEAKEGLIKADKLKSESLEVMKRLVEEKRPTLLLEYRSKVTAAAKQLDEAMVKLNQVQMAAGI